MYIVHIYMHMYAYLYIVDALNVSYIFVHTTTLSIGTHKNMNL